MVKNYNLFLDRLKSHFKGKELGSITSDHILQFLIQDTEGQKQSTKRYKYTLLKTLFNFARNTSDPFICEPLRNSSPEKDISSCQGSSVDHSGKGCEGIA